MTALAAPAQVAAWLRRYLPAEVIGTACALLSASVAYAVSGSEAAAALAAAWGENLGFYGLMVRRELARRGRSRALPRILVDLVLEFGPAEALDFLLRPALMIAATALAGSVAAGVVAGKIAADIAFYAPAIVSYELLRRREGRRAE